MSQVKRWTDAAAFALLLLIAAQMVDGGYVPWPDFIPDPTPAPTDSPFPAEGFFLLVAGNSSELDGTAVVAKSDAIRKEPGLESRWADYADPDTLEPWHSAIAWAKAKSGGKPYYVGRKGNKVAHGPLAGSVEEMHATLTKAMEGLR